MAPDRKQLLCPVLVGRDDEVAALHDALEQTLQGKVGAVFIAGEAGIGKSRLCRALMKEARARGLNPIAGLCAPQDADVPYGPIVDALRRAFTRIPADAGAIGTTLAPDLPTIAPLLPELGIDALDTPAGPPAMLRQRFFHALIQTLRAVAAYRPDAPSSALPLVLLVEDVHWADESTLDLLQYLLQSTRDIEEDAAVARTGVLVVCTFRAEALSSLPALRRTLSTLLAARLATHLELQPLTVQQFARFLAATLDRVTAPRVAQILFERCEGNPFIAEELLTALVASGQLDRLPATDAAPIHLPLSLRGAVLDRLHLLSAGARSLLAAAAVAGRAFDVDVLARVTGLDEAAVLDGLRAALHEGLIEENLVGGGTARMTTGDRYRFRHALTRDVIYGDLLAPERRRLHAAVARILEERVAGEGTDEADSIDAMAYHYRLAGDRVKAPLFALRAAERARTLLSFAEARRHYAEALSYLSQDDPARLALLEQLGLLSLALLDVQGAVPYLDAASALLRTLGLARKAAVVLGEMHHLLWYVDLARFRALVEELDAAAEAARTGLDGGGSEDADALLTYAAAALAHAAYAAYDRALIWAQRALDLTTSLDASESQAAASPAVYKALLARGHALVHGGSAASARIDGRDHGTVEAGLDDFRHALDLGLRHAWPEAVQLSYNFLPRALLDLGRDEEARRVIDQADAYAERSGVPAIADMRGYSLLYAGRWDEGVTLLRDASAASRAAGALSKCAMELTALGHLLVAPGDGTAAIAAFEEALPILEPGGQYVAMMPCLRGLAGAHALLGHHDEAAALFARAHALWRSTQDCVAVVPLLLEGCLYYASRGDARRAAEWAGDLERLADSAPLPVAAAAAAHAHGVALTAASDYAGAMELLLRAVERWDWLGRLHAAARARVSLGVALLAASRGHTAQRAEADAILMAATEIFSRFGAAHDLAEIEDIRRRAGLLAQARRRQSLAAARAPYGDLTPREREVLLLLAGGHTNREIAEALFITEGTTELHVSRILSKLGCATRAQAAAYALSHHLVPAS